MVEIFSSAFAQITVRQMAQAANIFAAAAATIAVLTVPYSLYALFRYERNEGVKATRANPDAHFRPSLFSLTWLTRVHVIGVVVVLLNYYLRVHYNLQAHELMGQPVWSYPMSMATSAVVLAVFVTPAIFLSWVKGEIVKESKDEAGP